jgi:hypothetical protein
MIRVLEREYEREKSLEIVQQKRQALTKEK